MKGMARIVIPKFKGIIKWLLILFSLVIMSKLKSQKLQLMAVRQLLLPLLKKLVRSPQQQVQNLMLLA
ncbi:hypothetical protein CDT89_01690 [Cronobacter sakazakii]|nr:hypothetical protein CDT89_01690 [Cronobacter sakazakii]PQY39617.1 hypothetical protein C5947_10515 [Cronobacter sakazakii]